MVDINFDHATHSFFPYETIREGQQQLLKNMLIELMLKTKCVSVDIIIMARNSLSFKYNKLDIKLLFYIK